VSTTRIETREVIYHVSRQFKQKTLKRIAISPNCCAHWRIEKYCEASVTAVIGHQKGEERKKWRKPFAHSRKKGDSKACKTDWRFWFLHGQKSTLGLLWRKKKNFHLLKTPSS